MGSINPWTLFEKEKRIMKHHQFNLERLANKWQARYGGQDPLVLDVKQELDRLALNHSNSLGCAFVAPEPSITHEKESAPSQAQSGD